MALKKIHFGERLEAFIDEKYKTQTEFAERIGRSQPTAARWCADPNFAATESVRKALRKLESDGVNPEYFWNPLVQDWRAPIKTFVDEMALHKLRTQLEIVLEERDRLIVKVASLEEKLKACKEKKNPHAN